VIKTKTRNRNSSSNIEEEEEEEEEEEGRLLGLIGIRRLGLATGATGIHTL
jgi:hypothetical protein